MKGTGFEARPFKDHSEVSWAGNLVVRDLVVQDPVILRLVQWHNREP